MDGKIWILLANGADQESSSFGLQNTCHILDAQDMGSNLDNLVDEVHVVFKIVLLLGIQHVTTVADSGLQNASCLLDGLHTNFQLVDVV